jgi:cobalamin synthase
LEYLATPRVLETLIASQAVPRAAMVAMAWCSRPAGSGLGFALASTLGTPAAVIAMAQGAAAALVCGWRPGFAMIAGSVLIVQAARAWFYRRIGGVNGDCLGFTEQLTEIFILMMFACRSCAW